MKMHSEYVSIDEVTTRDITYLPAGTKVWCEFLYNMPPNKDGQIVAPATDAIYASYFKMAFIH